MRFAKRCPIGVNFLVLNWNEVPKKDAGST